MTVNINLNTIMLIIDASRMVAPIREGGFSRGETWSTYAVYRIRDIKRIFGRGYSLRATINDRFPRSSSGPGGVYSRRASVRVNWRMGVVFVCQQLGLDI